MQYKTKINAHLLVVIVITVLINIFVITQHYQNGEGPPVSSHLMASSFPAETMTCGRKKKVGAKKSEAEQHANIYERKRGVDSFFFFIIIITQTFYHQ